MNIWSGLAFGVCLGFAGGYVVATQRAPSLEGLEQTHRDHGELIEELRSLTRRVEVKERVIEQLLRAAAQRLEGSAVASPSLVATAPSAGLREPEVSEEEDEFAAEPTAESEGTLREAHRLVEQGVAKGTWNDQDAENLRALLPKLPGEMRHRAIDRVIAAINSQQLRIETVGPPF